MSKQHTNPLSAESSPYLLQHAHNPVNWYPWGKEALDKAKAEDKPIIVSIGYSACHWCHVMERESFENETLAALMNRDFVCIKIDREERPDIDQIYMEAVQAMGINGGWPLNVFLTPDQKPFYGGTYFPPNAWAQVLRNVAQAFYGKREQLEESAENFKQAIAQSDIAKYGLLTQDDQFDVEDLDAMYRVLAKRFDRQLGGTDKAPKFPMPSIWRFLLRYYYETENNEAKNHLLLTLDSMAQGGIYDQVGGGFSRYSVDAAWFAPHFEKMLYDNGQLLSLYAEAYQVTQKPLYREVILQTIEWLQREMTSPEIGFYAALDADSEGVEGKFYTWTLTELEEIAGANAHHIINYYQATAKGNWEHGRNILHWSATDAEFAGKSGLELTDWHVIKARFISEALEKRKGRIRPGTDDKILAGWNGIMLKGLVDAYNALGKQEIIELAIENAHFIKKKLMKGDTLFRTYKNGTAKIEGYLEDYAFVIEAMVALYEATFDTTWLALGHQLLDKAIEQFYDHDEKFFFYTPHSAENLIARKKEVFDNVIPASNSAMAHVLYKLGNLLDRNDYIEICITMVGNMKKMMVQEPQYLANWAVLYADLCRPSAEIAMVGPDILSFDREISKHYIPNKVICGTLKDDTLPLLLNRTALQGKTTIYVCFQKSCKLPVHSVNEALAQLI